MGNPSTLAKLWTYNPAGTVHDNIPNWNPNDAKPHASIFEALRDNAVQSLITVCIGSVSGCVMLLLLIDYVPRRQFLMYSFIWMAALFFVTGGSFFAVFHNDLHAVSIVLVALAHFSFNLGPNTLTFVIPAELFPTRYRATCHGIAAAAGKLGSVIVQATLPTWTINGVRVADANSSGLGWVFITYGFVMALAAVFAWAWIPSLQYHRGADGAGTPLTTTTRTTRGGGLRLPSKTLEVLGEGIVRAEADGEVVGLRKRFGRWVSRFQERGEGR
jgi:PHS family inorganic phosphate transporter-like MFS transporter